VQVLQMFIYLNKKITIPNGVALRDLSWNTQQGWIACGGEKGLLKVLKLETAGKGRDKGIAGAANLAMNATLGPITPPNPPTEGHREFTVQVVRWNDQEKRLSTSDENGQIIVWVYQRGAWQEEMVNDRKKSLVADMKWTPDGRKICIVYKDGVVIMGSLDGQRLWGRETGMALTRVEWSPDCKFLLLICESGEVRVHDHHGNFLMNLPGTGDKAGASVELVHWYDKLEGSVDINAPALAVAFSNGRVNMLKNETDAQPVLVDTGLLIQVRPAALLAFHTQTHSHTPPAPFLEHQRQRARCRRRQLNPRVRRQTRLPSAVLLPLRRPLAHAPHPRLAPVRPLVGGRRPAHGARCRLSHLLRQRATRLQVGLLCKHAGVRLQPERSPRIRRRVLQRSDGRKAHQIRQKLAARLRSGRILRAGHTRGRGHVVSRRHAVPHHPLQRNRLARRAQVRSQALPRVLLCDIIGSGTRK